MKFPTACFENASLEYHSSAEAQFGYFRQCYVKIRELGNKARIQVYFLFRDKNNSPGCNPLQMLGDLN